MAKRILVADDEQDVREAVMEVLKAAGYVVESATTGAEAIELAGSRPFDLIITDYEMPGGTAKDVIEFAKKTLPKVPVIVMSGSALGWGLGRLARAEGILPKPFELQKLIGTVCAALEEPPFGPVG